MSKSNRKKRKIQLEFPLLRDNLFEQYGDKSFFPLHVCMSVCVCTHACVCSYLRLYLTCGSASWFLPLQSQRLLKARILTMRQ